MSGPGATPAPAPAPGRTGRSLAQWIAIGLVASCCPCPGACIYTHVRASSATRAICAGIKPGEPVEEVEARAKAAGLPALRDEEAPGGPGVLRLLATGGFPGAGAQPYLCLVTHDGKVVVSARTEVPED